MTKPEKEKVAFIFAALPPGKKLEDLGPLPEGVREIHFRSAPEVHLQWARLGDWGQLAVYIEDGGTITREMRAFFSEILRGERKKPNNRARSFLKVFGPRGEIQTVLFFRSRLERGLSRERAIDATAEEFQVDRRTVQRRLQSEAAVDFLIKRARFFEEASKKMMMTRYTISGAALTPHFLS